MANIYSYPQIGELTDADNLIISDAGNGNKTKSVTIEQLSDYFGVSAVRQAKKVLGPDEILSLSGPVHQFLEFVPAPGENKLLMPINLAYEVKFVSTPYNLAPTSLSIVLSSFGTGLEIPFSAINASQTARGWDLFGSNFTGVTSDIVNKPFNFTVNSGTVSQGDSLVTVSMLYRIIDFS